MKAQAKTIRVPNVPFRFFDILKYEIRNRVLIFVSILKLRLKTSKIRAPKVPFNFHFKIGMEKVIFRYFNFDSKLKIVK